jgi:hypothetical protein
VQVHDMYEVETAESKPPVVAMEPPATVRDTVSECKSHIPIHEHTIMANPVKRYINTPFCRFELSNPISCGNSSDLDDIHAAIAWLMEKGVVVSSDNQA